MDTVAFLCVICQESAAFVQKMSDGLTYPFCNECWERVRYQLRSGCSVELEELASTSASTSNTHIDHGRWVAPRDRQATDVRKAACHLVEIAALVRRNGNTNAFMESLCEAMNGVCQAIGERDAIGYVQGEGRFIVVTLG